MGSKLHRSCFSGADLVGIALVAWYHDGSGFSSKTLTKCVLRAILKVEFFRQFICSDRGTGAQTLVSCGFGLPLLCFQLKLESLKLFSSIARFFQQDIEGQAVEAAKRVLKLGVYCNRGKMAFCSLHSRPLSCQSTCNLRAFVLIGIVHPLAARSKSFQKSEETAEFLNGPRTELYVLCTSLWVQCVSVCFVQHGSKTSH